MLPLSLSLYSIQNFQASGMHKILYSCSVLAAPCIRIVLIESTVFYELCAVTIKYHDVLAHVYFSSYTLTTCNQLE